MDELLSFLRRLESAGIHYTLGSYRDTVNVLVTTPWNERWEVEYFADGSIEIERFVSTGDIESDPALLGELFRDR